MHFSFLFLLSSLAGRDLDFILCRARPPMPTSYPHPVPVVAVNPSLSHSLNALPALNICCNRKLLPLPRTKLNLSVGLLLLLAGDVSVNPGPTHNLRVGSINARSMRAKAPVLTDLISTKSLDILGITETWLTPRETAASLADITPAGFSFHQIPRPGRPGGGVGLFVASSLKFSEVTIPTHSSFEAICGRISTGKVCLNVLNIYRPPGTCNIFFEELQDTLSHMVSLPHDLLIMGDFNLHVNVPSKQTTDFQEILSSFDLHQHVDFPTHIYGHSLDLLISPNYGACRPTSVVASDRISDHFTIIAEMKIPVTTHTHQKTIQYRNIKGVDVDAFKDDILNSDLLVTPRRNASDLAKQYWDTLATIFHRHAPLITKRISPKPVNPWLTPDILEAKRRRKYLERIWRKNRTPLNRSRYTRQTLLYNRMMAKAKSAYLSDIIDKGSSDQRGMWKAFNKILHRHPTVSLPECTSIAELANSFGSFFVDKISVIRSSFAAATHLSNQDTAPQPNASTINVFSPASEEEIRRLIMAAPNKSCDLDPIPTCLLKSCIDVLIKPITSMINLSLSEGVFPMSFKKAHVTPLLKKPTLSKDDMKNYRPVSNLSFISKVLEKVVASRLQSHIQMTNTSNLFQSAYKKLHSTETALLKVHNDIITAMDKGKVTALTLLDLSAAFDTIDHPILLDRLESWFGITGLALDWVTSYLTDRYQQVKIDTILSTSAPIPFGVPQGSVLGPLLFTLYTTPLSSVINRQSIHHHLYADDSQLYISFSSSDSAESLKNLQACLASVQQWMLSNKLKLNPDKTEFLLIGHELQRQKYLCQFPLPLLGMQTNPSKSARNLGVTFDHHFKFRSHISQVCRSCFYHIRDIRRIRRYLSLENAKTLAHAMVTSRLDYCNSLLFALPAKDINRLQRVQNSLARVVTRSPPRAHSAPLLYSLHWLPVNFRIQFKINLLTYNTLSSEQPSYLHDLLKVSVPNRSLRSSNKKLLTVPRVKSHTGTRAFSSCAPVLWNNLPLSLRLIKSKPSFRKHLKTHLFGMAYPP